MGSTSVNLHEANNGYSPQGYEPSTDLYKPILVRQVESSGYAQVFQTRGYVPFAVESITVTTSGVSLNSTTYSGAVYAEAQVQGGLCYVRRDGTLPSSSIGLQADDLDIIVLESSAEIANFRILKGSTSTTTLFVEYST